MDAFWQEVGLTDPNWAQFLRIGLRLGCAVLFAGAVGFEREVRRHPAGLRTHMLVALGAALFTLVPMEAGATSAELSRMVQGLAAGIGFLGAGAILKREDEKHIHGLTTAAGIWLVAAVGFACGSGQLAIAFFVTLITLVILLVLIRVEEQIGPHNEKVQ